MWFGMSVVFLVLISAVGILAWLIWRRMAEYLKGNDEAVSALIKHLFVPLLGKSNGKDDDSN